MNKEARGACCLAGAGAMPADCGVADLELLGSAARRFTREDGVTRLES